MIQELLYTSHEGKGLRHSAGGGYCTVLSTEGMATNLAIALEKLSGYKHPFDIHDPRAPHSPTVYRHTIIRVGGITYHVLSRIANLRREHTGRSNKLAHHLALTTRDLPIGGPSWIMMTGDVCRKDWDGRVRLVNAIDTVTFPHDDIPAKPCTAWKESAGDAGWAGYVADQLNRDDATRVSIIYPLHTNTLALVNEALSLLAHERRWQVTFSTYFTALPAGTSCQLRFYLDGTTEAEKLRHDNRERIIDLTSRLGAAPESALADTARTGRPARSTVTTAVERPATQPSPTEPTAFPGARSEADAASRPNNRVTVASSDSGDEYHLMPPTLRRNLRSRQQYGSARKSHSLPSRKRRLVILAASMFTAFLVTIIGIGAVLFGFKWFDYSGTPTASSRSGRGPANKAPSAADSQDDGIPKNNPNPRHNIDVATGPTINGPVAGTSQKVSSQTDTVKLNAETDSNSRESSQSRILDFPDVLVIPRLTGSDGGLMGGDVDNITEAFDVPPEIVFSMKQLIGTSHLVESESICTEPGQEGETLVVLKRESTDPIAFARFRCQSGQIEFEWIKNVTDEHGDDRPLFRGIRWCVAQFEVDGDDTYVLLSLPETEKYLTPPPEHLSPSSPIKLEFKTDSRIPNGLTSSGCFIISEDHDYLRVEFKDDSSLSVFGTLPTRAEGDDDSALGDSEVLRIGVRIEGERPNRQLICHANLFLPKSGNGSADQLPKKIDLADTDALKEHIGVLMKQLNEPMAKAFGSEANISPDGLYHALFKEKEREGIKLDKLPASIYRSALAIEAVKWLQAHPPSWKGHLTVDYDAEGDAPLVTVFEFDLPIVLPEVKINDPANGTPERNP